MSVADGGAANILPMDLIGPVGTDTFSIALHHTSKAFPLVEQSRRIALSAVPIAETATVYRLGKNHRQQSLTAGEIPFPTMSSAVFGLPVPRFALRVREVQIVTARPQGSHTMLLGNTVEDTSYGDGEQLHVIHGLYHAWKRGAHGL